VSLCVLELTDLLLLLEFVVLHSGTDVVRIGCVLRMEHVSTEVQDALLVHALLVGLSDLQLGELLHEVRNALDEVRGFDRCGEPLLRQIRQANQTMNNTRHGQGTRSRISSGPPAHIRVISDELEELLHGLLCHSGVLLEGFEGRAGMQDVGEQS